jgi:hypothetical protein
MYEHHLTPEYGRRRHAPSVPVDVAVVSRRIGVPVALLEVLFDDPDLHDRLATVDLAGRGLLTVDQPIAPTRSLIPTWGGAGRLHGRRRIRSIPVTIEVSAWSAGVSELRVSPAAVRPHRWPNRRLRRYFELAHAAADELVRRLSRPAATEPTPGVVLPLGDLGPERLAVVEGV